jgi:hypothetical protein
VDQQANKALPTRSSVKGLIAACALLAAILLPAGLAIGWAVARRMDAFVLQAALLAVGVCWLAAVLALLATHIGTVLGAPIQGLLISMMFRMGLPMAAGMALSQVAPLAEVGIFSMILGVYLCALLVETLLSLRMIQPAQQKTPAAS